MTNHWADIDNASLIVPIGANPSENHPACMAHVNTARFDVLGRGRKAQMIVVDPRQTRTARQIDPSKGDRYIRIRPGTDIAFVNGLERIIIERMEAAVLDSNDPDYTTAVKFFAWHNGTATNSTKTRTFLDDAGVNQNVASWPGYCDSRLKVNVAGDDYQRTTLAVGAGISNFPVLAADVSDPDCVYQKLKAHVAPYTTAVTADICGCTEPDLVYLADALVKHSRFASSDFAAATSTPANAGYRVTTYLYAMGLTQSTVGSQKIRGLAVIQTLLGNMGRAGGGINALRGIHNVQGSTDMANLFDGIPGYSGNPATTDTFGTYMNSLFGNRLLNGSGTTTTKSPYVRADGGLQQRGFFNMTREWFGNRDVPADGTGVADIDKLWALWPKGNGLDHISAFRKMLSTEPEASRIKALVNWGQNPAVTEPNQKFIRQALEDLDLLVCVDMFANETAQTKRKDSGRTYLIPACAHVEEAGSVTSSGRWIQWRERAVAPKGKSKSDLELMLTFAKALNTAGAFDHIKAQWAGMATASLNNGGVGADPFTVLYAKYGWNGVESFEGKSATLEMWKHGDPAPADKTVYGSEVIADNVFQEIAGPLDSAGIAGTVWIYSGNGNAAGYWGTVGADVQPAMGGEGWRVKNRAKSRRGEVEWAGGALTFSRFGWAWLLNRRVFYNNGEVPGDVPDNFVAPGLLSRLFVSNANTFADWSQTAYRKYTTLADVPSAGVGVSHVLPGRFPGHAEPTESPRADLVTTWGHNLRHTTTGNVPCVPATTTIGTVANFPLVLTTIRCVEHFQGGPITRNNPWNHEMEPEPWIEINSVDALKYGIKDGQYVNVTTARSNSTSDEQGRTKVDADSAAFTKGFKARVGVGTLANQRVAPGVVAIPWHWGERGLSKGARANDLCIDASDANTYIPEYKACLCKIQGL